MEKKYYHDTYFRKIINLTQENRYEESINEFQKYLNTYTKDVNGYVYYANILIKMNRLEEAEVVLNTIENMIEKTTSILTCEDFMRTKIFLLCVQKRYQECYQMLQDNIAVFFKRKWFHQGLLYYLKKELRLLASSDYKQITVYLHSQILSYNETAAIHHIKKHQDIQTEEELQFLENFPLQEMYYYFRKVLPNNKKYIEDCISNSYVFQFNGNGHVYNKLVDFIKVITLPDSNNIITIYPYENLEKREYIDITPELDEPLKRKRISQIDKFNRRYGNEKIVRVQLNTNKKAIGLFLVKN